MCNCGGKCIRTRHNLGFLLVSLQFSSGRRNCLYIKAVIVVVVHTLPSVELNRPATLYPWWRWKVISFSGSLVLCLMIASADSTQLSLLVGLIIFFYRTCSRWLNSNIVISFSLVWIKLLTNLSSEGASSFKLSSKFAIFPLSWGHVHENFAPFFPFQSTRRFLLIVAHGKEVIWRGIHSDVLFLAKILPCLPKLFLVMANDAVGRPVRLPVGSRWIALLRPPCLVGEGERL